MSTVGTTFASRSAPPGTDTLGAVSLLASHASAKSTRAERSAKARGQRRRFIVEFQRLGGGNSSSTPPRPWRKRRNASGERRRSRVALTSLSQRDTAIRAPDGYG